MEKNLKNQHVNNIKGPLGAFYVFVLLAFIESSLKKCTPANQSLTCFREGAGVAEELNKVNDRYEEEKIQVQTAHKAAEKASKPIN